MRRSNGSASITLTSTTSIGALDVSLSADDLRRIDEIAPKGVAAGTRYPEAGMKAVNR